MAAEIMSAAVTPAMYGRAGRGCNRTEGARRAPKKRREQDASTCRARAEG